VTYQIPSEKPESSSEESEKELHRILKKALYRQKIRSCINALISAGLSSALLTVSVLFYNKISGLAFLFNIIVLGVSFGVTIMTFAAWVEDIKVYKTYKDRSNRQSHKTD